MSTRLPLPDDIKELIGLVRAGKLFDVQRWIADGKQTVPFRKKARSSLAAPYGNDETACFRLRFADDRFAPAPVLRLSALLHFPFAEPQAEARS